MPTNKAGSHLDAAYEASSFRRIGHELIDLMADHLERAGQAQQPLIQYRKPAEELAFWEEDFTGESDDPMDFFRKVIEHSIHLHHPHYIGHQVSVPIPINALAGMVSDILSNGTGVYEMGMASNALERVVTNYTAQKIGYADTAGGMLTSGGTLANLTGLLAARSAKAPGPVWEAGQQNRLAVMVSAEAHYCVDRAVRIMGMGSAGIIKVPVDKQFKIRTDLLETYYQKAAGEGLSVIAVVGCAGSTATGSYDDLEALANFCQKHDLWFHVDGAHGGAVVFSDKYKMLTKGIERADTVVLDYHKLLMTPALNTALIFKEDKRVYETFTQKAQYLWEAEQEPEWFHSGKRTFECTKLMLSIKVYAAMRTFGKEIFAENVDRLYDRTKVFAGLLSASPDFELAVEPESNILNFRYSQGPTGARDETNSRIRQQLMETGSFYIVQTLIDGERWLRATVMNPFTEEAHFVELLETIRGLSLAE